MKKTYQQPATTVCSISMKAQLLAGSLGLYNELGDADIHLSRPARNFDDEEDEEENNTGHNSFSIWD